jgi:UDP-N-acetylglucosamine 2-epimerase (non-hydrolysing)
VRLSCCGEPDPDAHVAKVAAALQPLFAGGPDLVIVQGDTSSALGGALAATRAGVPLAHVEAGLRTHDPLQPWPEEQYRTQIDAHGDLLFAPTQLSASNLHRERLAGEVHVTGNTAIDALLGLIERLPPPAPRQPSELRILVTCHRRESWGEGLCAIGSALAQIAAAEAVRIDFVLHPNGHVARTMTELLRPTPAVELVEPCTHAELVQRMRAADLILSDSGGIQEEAPAIGVPLLVLRDKTERPEGLATGNMRLVGTNADDIVSEALALLRDPAARAKMSRPALPYGDGRSAERIAGIVESWLQGKAAGERRTA